VDLSDVFLNDMIVAGWRFAKSTPFTNQAADAADHPSLTVDFSGERILTTNQLLKAALIWIYQLSQIERSGWL